MKIDFPLPVKKLIKKFHENNYQIFIVGGAVRDVLMEREVADWDFTTNASPSEIQAIFPKNSFYNNKFGTVRVVFGEKNKPLVFEVTTFRKEFKYSDKRHPDKIIWGKTIEEDLSRRDFTINAIALAGKTKKIIDPFGGQKDLDKKIIKAVGKPDQRFSEDALRMMRAIRIASQLGFTIEEKTFTSIKKNVSLIKNISWERIRDELFKILVSPYPAEGIRFLYASGLLKYILPEIIAGKGVAQAKHHSEDVWNHSLKSLACCPSKNAVVRLATLLHDVGKPATAQGEGEERTFYNHEMVGAKIAARIGKRLRLSKKDAEKLYKMVRWHQFTVNEKQTDKAIRRFIRKVGKENLKDILDLRVGDRLGGGAKETSWRLELFKKRLAEVQKQPFSLKDLKINGNDVMRVLKISSGPKVGHLLKILFAEVEKDKKLNTRKKLLARLKKINV